MLSCVEVGLGFCGRDVPDGLENASVVEPVHPFEGCIFHGLEAAPRATSVNDLGLEETVDRLGKRVVITIADAADRGFDPGFGEALGVANGQILAAPVAMVDKTHAFGRTTFMDSLFEGVEDEPGMGRGADPPADDPPGEGVDYEGYIGEPFPGGDVSEIADLLPGWRCLHRRKGKACWARARGTPGLPCPTGMVRSCLGWSSLSFSADAPCDDDLLHQPGHCTAGNMEAFAAQLVPEPPRVYRRAFCSKLGGFFKGVQVFVESFLRFIGREISDSTVEALRVVPIDPFQLFPFQLADGFPGAV